MIEFISFLFFVLFFLYLPGKFIAEKLQLKLEFIEDLFFNSTLGLLLFTLTIYIFSWIKADFIKIPLFIFLDFLVIKKRNFLPKKLEKKHIKPILLVLSFSFIFSLSMTLTGKFGDTFIYGRDDLWHLALINELKNTFPPEAPGFAGVGLRGYHFFYNLVLAKSSTFFSISPSSLHFHFFPALLALLTGMGTYAFVFRWSKKISTSLWAVFLTMFGGSFSYVYLLMGKSISSTYSFKMSLPVFTLYNPPLAVSIIILLFALFSIFEYLSSRDNRWLIPFVLAAGLISMFKVYAGIILIVGFAFLVFLEALKKRFVLIFPLVAVSIIFFLTYWIFAGGDGYLIFYPLWPSQRLLMDLSWYGYDEKIYTYTKENVLRGILKTEAYGLFLFFVGGLGTRILGILTIPILYFKKLIKFTVFELMLITMTLISILTPLFFIQSGKVFEIIQMTHYFVFFISLFTAFGLTLFFELNFNKVLKIILAAAFIVLTLPNTYFVLRNNIVKLDDIAVSKSNPYFQTMNFLAKQGNYESIVLELPPREVKPTDEDLISWYNQFSSPAVIAFGNKRSFISNQFIEFPGTNKDERLNLLKKVIIFSTTDPALSVYPKLKNELEKELKDNGIKYIYSPYDIFSFSKIENIEKIFKKELHIVYRVIN